jgi:SAM-dependent methyltransferase
MMTIDELLTLLLQSLSSSGFRQASFAGKPHGPNPLQWKRVQLRMLVLRDAPHLQFTYFDGRQTLTKNFLLTELEQPVRELLSIQFSDIHLSLASREHNIRVSKQGKVHVATRKQDLEKPIESHNRTKNVPLPEGTANPVLEMMGILTASGQVKPTMRSKYVQINEFLKHLLHVLDDSGLLKLDRPIEILDCGCGAAYLTIAVHHFLNDVLKRPARVIGVDVNEDVIRKSIARTESNASGMLNFHTGKIGEIQAKPDIVLALHACNRATDDAILQAIRSEAKLFLGVPCCHQDLNQQLQAGGEALVMRPILRHGIFRERQAEILTDTFRSLWLRRHGYRAEVVEFTSPEHTARNVMIRAFRAGPAANSLAEEEFNALKAFWGVNVWLEEATHQQKKPDPNQDQASQ